MATRTLGVVEPNTPLPGVELHILSMIAQGLTNPQIAAAIRLHEETVKIHVRRLLRRLGATNRAHAVALAFAPAGWASVPNVAQSPAGRAIVFTPRPLPTSAERTAQLMRDAAQVSA